MIAVRNKEHVQTIEGYLIEILSGAESTSNLQGYSFSGSKDCKVLFSEQSATRPTFLLEFRDEGGGMLRGWSNTSDAQYPEDVIELLTNLFQQAEYTVVVEDGVIVHYWKGICEEDLRKAALP